MRQLICDFCNNRIYETGVWVKVTRTLFEWLHIKSKAMLQLFYPEGNKFESGNKFEICEICSERLKRLITTRPNAINELRTYMQRAQVEGHAIPARPTVRGYAAAPPRIRTYLEEPLQDLTPAGDGGGEGL